MRRLLKFLHTMGSIGLMGAMAAMLVLFSVAPPPSSLAGYALIRGAMGAVATWIFLPSLALVLVAGLLAMALHPVYRVAGWAWLKLATGVLMFEGGFVYIQGPMQREAAMSAAALAGKLDPAALAVTLGPERNTLWVLLAVATANVALGIWRPRVLRLPAT
ncbi:hypothetical protein [Methylobacterium persicinum]|uniref:DUF2269 domain-containing protein n=1 Tax=Methylobacterium persicinum TaxID=374426 RepID=A0ABU0HG05_9HYPH|nr:hypothetical protein [Methylobacterium persicinum]MDQ0441244.1 hypothetical protein [Methylobacterium persicinum]GJE35998.1 hypothetical protein KHHGKMAE_0044 [Methylobacterium persicinum]